MINGIRRFGVTSDAKTGSRLISSPSYSKKVGVNSSRNHLVTADYGSASTNSNNNGSTGSQTVIGKNITEGFLDNFLPPGDTKLRHRIFRDIYYHDPVAGGAVDMLSMVPWSNFTLNSIKDKSVLETYHRSCDRMRLNIMLPAISRDYLVAGKFIGSLSFDSSEGIFTSILPQNADFVNIVEVPIYGHDPLLNLEFPPAVRKLLQDTSDPRVKNLLNLFPEDIRSRFNESSIPLQPENTIYLPRRTLTSDSTGTSYYERILMIHMMEKSLWRGSLDQIQRRQRAIMHIIVQGESEEYIPSPADLEEVKSLFSLADADPTGAIIVTRSGIQPTEVRDPTQFMFVESFFDFFSAAKYRALGISESVLLGDANFSTMDASLTIFVEQLRTYRDMITQELFYNKIFPLIAIANGFTNDRYEVTGSSNNNPRRIKNNGYSVICSGRRNVISVANNDVDMSSLIMPNIVWHKHLKPEGDQQYLENLNAMVEHGIPVGLSMYAAAGGIDISNVLNNLDEEVSLRKKIAKYNDKISKYLPQQEEQDGGQDKQNYSAQSSLFDITGGTVKPYKLGKRQFREEDHLHNIGKNGKIKNTSKKGQKYLNERFIKKAAEVLANISTRENAKIKSGKKENKKPMVSAMFGKM